MGPVALDQVIEAMIDVVLVVDVQGRIIGANSAAIRVTGYDPEYRPSPRLGEHTEMAAAREAIR